jgi:hypothetical protein
MNKKNNKCKRLCEMKKLRNGFFWGVIATINLDFGYAKIITATPVAAPSLENNENSTDNPNNQETSIILPYFTVGADQPEGYIPTQTDHQVFMLFSPSCQHCLDFITTQLPLIQKQIALDNIEVNIGFNPMNSFDMVAIKIIVGTLYKKNTIIYNQKGQAMKPLDMLITLMEKRSEWLEPTIEFLTTGNKEVVQQAINNYIETVNNEQEKNNWLAILDQTNELTYLKIFCGKFLGLDPNYVQNCIENENLNKIIALFPTVLAKGECTYAPFFCVNGNHIPSGVPLTNELMKKYINDLTKNKEIYTSEELKQQLEQKIIYQQKKPN